MLEGKRILLIISGGIAAYKSLELIRLIRQEGASVRCILTKAATQFVTPLSVAALTGEKIYDDLFSLTGESEMGHIQLSRDADLLVVCPATANILARIAHGICDDLATTALLATDKPVMTVPAMNVKMWQNPATCANIELLRGRGIILLGPIDGDMACGEFGPGRMVEPESILAAICEHFKETALLSGKRALVTSGPTFEAIDPVRYLGNRSSGKQGHAIASEISRLGAETVLITGPTALKAPSGVSVVHVETACEMYEACKAALPADIAVCAAAVADWRPEKTNDKKIKKNGEPPVISMIENPDILKFLGNDRLNRPALLIGFAAETGDVVEKAQRKLAKKKCDWLLANDVSVGTNVFGGESNTIHFISRAGTEPWPKMTKKEVASRIALRISDYFREGPVNNG